jgi:hypothetical protein
LISDIAEEAIILSVFIDHKLISDNVGVEVGKVEGENDG